MQAGRVRNRKLHFNVPNINSGCMSVRRHRACFYCRFVRRDRCQILHYHFILYRKCKIQGSRAPSQSSSETRMIRNSQQHQDYCHSATMTNHSVGYHGASQLQRAMTYQTAHAAAAKVSAAERQRQVPTPPRRYQRLSGRQVPTPPRRYQRLSGRQVPTPPGYPRRRRVRKLGRATPLH